MMSEKTVNLFLFFWASSNSAGPVQNGPGPHQKANLAQFTFWPISKKKRKKRVLCGVARGGGTGGKLSF